MLLISRLDLGGPVRVGGSPLVGQPAPDFELTSLAGSAVRLADLRGRPVIVNFWASWCEPCKDEFPLLAAARERHADAGLEILGIVHDDSVEAARAFVEAQGASWPILLDPEDRAWEAYRALALPMTFYVDREGVVRNVSFGPPASGSFDTILEAIL